MHLLKKYRSQLIVGSIFILPVVFYVLLSIGKHNFNRLPYYTKNQTVTDIKYAEELTRFEGLNQDGEEFISENRGKITLWNLVRTDDYLLTPAVLANLQFLQDSFKDQKEVQFKSLVVQNTTSEQVRDFIKALNINTRNWQVLFKDSLTVNRFVQNELGISYKVLPDSLHQVIPSVQVVLTDQNLHIRGYFDGATHKEVKGELLDAIDMLIREQYITYKDKK